MGLKFVKEIYEILKKCRNREFSENSAGRHVFVRKSRSNMICSPSPFFLFLSLSLCLTLFLCALWAFIIVPLRLCPIDIERGWLFRLLMTLSFEFYSSFFFFLYFFLFENVLILSFSRTKIRSSGTSRRKILKGNFQLIE